VPPGPLVFAAIGDYGQQGVDAAAVAELVKSWNPELIITLGDNNYPDGAFDSIDANIGQYYHEFISPYLGEYGEGADVNRFFPSPGNHDWQTPGLEPYLDYFTLPGNERYYQFVWGPVHFFSLDSDSREPDGVGMSSVQAQWLQLALASSTSPWQVVFMHHPPYSSSRHGSTDWMQWPFAEWGVDAVLAGHDHVYERLLIDGIPYITNGLGGYPNRYFFFMQIEGSQFQYRAGYGALRVVADETTLSIEMITVEGDLLIFETCINLVRTIPALVHDKTNIEDVNTHGPDHWYDAARYLTTPARDYVEARQEEQRRRSQQEAPIRSLTRRK
jgi:3',5'-cyclic AMP phosphodiesterase CpdA